MRTFKIELALDTKVVVPEQFTKNLRAQAIAPDATDFLIKANEKFKDDDEGFTLHIIKHGIRREARNALANLFASSGLGCTLSPARATVIDRSPPTNVKPVLANQIDSMLCAGDDGGSRASE